MKGSILGCVRAASCRNAFVVAVFVWAGRGCVYVCVIKGGEGAHWMFRAYIIKQDDMSSECHVWKHTDK